MKLNHLQNLKSHLLAALTSLILVSVIGFVGLHFYSGSDFNEIELQKKLNEKYQNFAFKLYYPTFQNDYNEGYHALKFTLENGGIALLGSSELTSYKSRFTTYNFMKDQLGVDLRAFGHAGYQNKAILTELMSVYSQKVAENGRVVILLSPSWFADGDRMHEGLWKAEIASPIMMSRIRENSLLPVELKNSVVSFFENIETLSSINIAFRRNYDEKFLAVDRLAQAKPSNIVLPDWESWKTEALNFEKKLASNEYGINDEYFNLYIKPVLGTSKFPFKIATGVSIDKNKEIEDFKILLNFLKTFKVKPLFVMLPLNRKAYSNLQVLDDEIKYVEQLINEHNYPLLDFWFAENPPGVLTDVMHTGAYGWVAINEFIYKNQTSK